MSLGEVGSVIVNMGRCSVDSQVVGESMAWICKLGKGSLERICKIRVSV